MSKQLLSEIIHNCQQETALYKQRRGKAGRSACFELFHLALKGDDLAWSAIYNQYHRLVAKWVNGPSEETEDRVQIAFEKFFRSVDAKTFVRKFPDIGRVMSFFRTIAMSVQIDEERKIQREAILVSLETVTGSEFNKRPEKETADKMFSNELWQKISSLLKDEQEKIVMELSFQQNLKPKQIAEQYPNQFKDVVEVRRIKERVLLRLKNNPQLHFWRQKQN